jgi:hypothetical protein
MSQTTVAAAELAGEKAAEVLAAEGMEAAAVEAGKKKAQEAVLNQTVKRVATQGVGEAAKSAIRSTLGRAAFLGMSIGAWILLGIGIAAIGIGGYIYSRGDAPVEAGPRAKGEDCPPLTRTAHKCPWTPDGHSVGECTPGFCWDGGPQGALACKQEADVPNSGRTYTSDLVCNEGFEANKDPCTGVILSCDAKAQ